MEGFWPGDTAEYPLIRTALIEKENLPDEKVGLIAYAKGEKL